ncbi:hypothetical protein CYLTODRAFT_441216 [Cylindrobasidium torrendii FP15055 ss-10]|uniref:Uncharacterized protein n=1 Tax=Cylindrobasidium torrendii FP15055 ss-10 TaxID=1314674 RepID=A0A0D7BMY4_9AGAR|nr:hypothetical protein CYLTODRAFT_441216 [Cylindrobasidium torrendii FP15055 ss-10]
MRNWKFPGIDWQPASGRFRTHWNLAGDRLMQWHIRKLLHTCMDTPYALSQRFPSQTHPGQTSLSTLDIGKARHPSRPLRGHDLRRLLDDSTDSNPTGKRVVSDPLPIRRNLLSGDTDNERASSSPPPRHLAPPCHSKTAPVPQPYSNDNDAVLQKLPTVVSGAPILPIGTPRPVAFDTNGLPPRTHKTVQGQLTILPSSSLLVDFREGERRRGNSGDQVFIVKIYDAPHLSTPCCLAEPAADYATASLPIPLWKTFNDVAEIVAKIKSRTPKLVLHEPGIKCTLMSNEPAADIELLFLRGSNTSREETSDSARMRLRLCRQSGTLEVARCTTTSRGKEWHKQMFSHLSADYSLSALDQGRLEHEEKAGLLPLSRFLKLCESYSGINTSVDLASPEQPLWRSSIRAKIFTSSSSTLPPLKLAPRPAKISTSTSRFSAKELAPLQSVATRVDPSLQSALVSTLNHPSRTLGSSQAQGAMTCARFLPAVGWCIRQCLRTSLGGQYKIMFIDGAVLDVDVDEGWVQLLDSSGNTTRCNLHDKRLNRTIGERMGAFNDFVELFEDAV